MNAEYFLIPMIIGVAGALSLYFLFMLICGVRYIIKNYLYEWRSQIGNIKCTEYYFECGDYTKEQYDKAIKAFRKYQRRAWLRIF